MKEQIQPTILLPGAFYRVSVSVCAVPFAFALRNATKQSVAKPANIVTDTNDSGPWKVALKKSR